MEQGDDKLASETPSPSFPLSELFRDLPRAPLPNPDYDIADSTLLAHYLQRTSLTLSAASKSEKRAQVWRQGIPFVASRHQSVSHAIAATAAIHISVECLRPQQSARSGFQQLGGLTSPTTTPQVDPELSAKRYLHQATVHHGHCLRWYQDELRSLSEENADAVLACSALLLIYGLGYSQVERRLTKSSSPPAKMGAPESQGQHMELDLTWINLQRGIKPVHHTAIERHHQLEGSVISPLLEWEEEELVPATEVPTSSSPSTKPYVSSPSLPEHPLCSKIFEQGGIALVQLQGHLESTRSPQDILREPVPSSSSDSLKFSLEALDMLQTVARRFTETRGSSSRILVGWVSFFEDSFLRLLTEQDIFALAVYAHFLVYTILLEDLWWIGDLGVATIRDILDGVSVEERGYRQELFAWPARTLELYANASAAS